MNPLPHFKRSILLEPLLVLTVVNTLQFLGVGACVRGKGRERIYHCTTGACRSNVGSVVHGALRQLLSVAATCGEAHGVVTIDGK